MASIILSHTHSCRGGGIPSSIVAIRGIVSFKWLTSLIALPISALLTFFCGIPLGTEGPCVQMGTAIGDGVVKCFSSEKHKGWRRYVMTGGASAGFSIATASPITAVIFSIEELHKHFSPLLLIVTSLSVLTAQATSQLLSFFGIGNAKFFDISVLKPLEPKMLFVPLLVGIICGICYILFTRFYHIIDNAIHSVLKKVSIKIALPILFACASVIGFFLADALGTGHSLTESLFRSHAVWYSLIFVLLIRISIMMISNTAGVTGGVFLPTVASGAIIGALCAECLIALGIIESDYYILIVVLGITSFLGSTSRIPVTACIFAIEALGAVNNTLPVIIATTFAMIIAELSGLDDFTDTIIKSKIRSISKGKMPTVIVVPLTVKPNSFASGKELYDILWPNSCVILSLDHAQTARDKNTLEEGDIVTVRYETYDPSATAKELKALVGEQSKHIEFIMNPMQKSPSP
jgi:H+/Cl- antiporter ClcA